MNQKGKKEVCSRGHEFSKTSAQPHCPICWPGKASPKKGFETIDEYIKTFPKNIREILGEIRQVIKDTAPDAVEVISYQMPAFKFNGRILVYFAAFTNHIGMYPPAPKAFSKEVAPYAGPKGNLKFPLDQPMPLDLIRKIVAYKVRDKI